jgi:hypothetical protein
VSRRPPLTVISASQDGMVGWARPAAGLAQLITGSLLKKTTFD